MNNLFFFLFDFISQTFMFLFVYSVLCIFVITMFFLAFLVIFFIVYGIGLEMATEERSIFRST